MEQKNNAMELIKQAFREATAQELDALQANANVQPPPIVYANDRTPLCPGHPKICLGSGTFPGFPCRCDTCDYQTACKTET